MQSKLKIGDRVVNGVYLSLYEKYKSCIYLTTAISLILLVCLADMSHAETEFSGNIQSDMTLTQENSPYRVTAYVRVLDNVTLTIEPGVELRFNWNVGIDINGYLSAVGTAANPVIFTGSEETAGYWRAINIQNQGSARLEHCQVTYGGSLGNGIVKTGSGNLTMKNTTIANTNGIGLIISANTGEVLVEDSVFESNVEGLTLRDGGPVTVRSSLFKNNTRYGIILQAQDAPPTDPSNSFSGNELADIGVLRGSIPADLTWRPAGAPIRIVGYVTVDEGATLTIEPGTRVKLNGNVGLEINGHLSAVGTSGNPIVFTRGEEAVWRAINIQNQGSARLEHCQVTYGGSLGNGIVKTGSGNLTLKNTTVANTNGIGLIIQNSTGLHTVASNTFSANTIGVDVSNQENDLILTNNIIEDNENFGVRNQSAADIIIDARDNWWGHETGPFHAELNPGGQGDTISDGVLFDPWKTTPVEGTAAGTPSSIQVPPTSTTGSYTVSWGSSSTSGVTYVLEEATNSTFTSGRRTAYTGSNLSASITGRSDGIYYYRVKATKDGYEDSDWRTGSNECTVNVESAEVTVNPVTSNTVSFGDIINVPEEITWVWLWTGNEVDGKYTGSLVNTSSFNIFGEGWIEVDDLDNLKLDFAQHDNTILYVLPWASGTIFDWQKFEVDFQASDQVRNSVNLDITQDTYASEIFKVENIQHGQHWLQLWIGDYLDTSAFNIFGNGWIEASDLSRFIIQGDAFSGGDNLWIRQYSQSPGLNRWIDYGWLELKE